MTKSRTIKDKILAAALAVGLLVSASVAPAFAAEGTSNAQITFSGGELLLVSASNIVFEPGTITSVDTEYDAENKVDIVIADNRGNDDGWQLTAELGVFTIGGREALQSATITVNNITLSKANDDNPSGTPVAAEKVTLVAGSGIAAPVATAAEGQGSGGWTVSFSQAGIELAVKADTARAGLATARIDWIIADAA